MTQGHNWKDREKESEKAAKKKKHVQRVEIERAAGGGYIVRHHMAQTGPTYYEPEQHVFEDGEKMMDHVGMQMGMRAKKKEDEGEEE